MGLSIVLVLLLLMAASAHEAASGHNRGSASIHIHLSWHLGAIAKRVVFSADVVQTLCA